MASDSQWSGLLIVVIFVAIFAITSVSAMAIYFFCKCHKKKQKGMQVRPAPRIADEESEDDESGTFYIYNCIHYFVFASHKLHILRN